MRKLVYSDSRLRRSLRLLAALVRGETGAVMVIVAGGMVILLGMAGLALDTGRAFLVKAQLSRAVDAGVLAGARAVRGGESVARSQALAVSRANGVDVDDPLTKVDVSFGTDGDGNQTVTMTARRPMRTALMKLLGQDVVDVASSATAVVPPIDLVLVVDQSGSLESANAWDDLQRSVGRFAQYFSEEIDQMSLVSFGTRGATRIPLQTPFKNAVSRQISGMNSVGWTNTGEGLELAYRQITGPSVRERAVKVVVFFTDGRPTAFRGQVGGSERILAVAAEESNVVRGYFDNPDRIPVDEWLFPPDDACRNVVNCRIWTEGGHPPHGRRGREIARNRGISAAARLRDTGAYIYVIALGNPMASELATPDLGYLARLSNQQRGESREQPSGRVYFAPDAHQLEGVFRRVAHDLVVRLSH